MMKFARTSLSLVTALVVVTGCEIGSKDVEQLGYRGVAMEQVSTPESLASKLADHQPPPASPQIPAAGPKAKDIYQNVQVLGDLGVGQFTRLMASITQWVSPEEGCNYCHVEGGALSDDSKYTKVVSRRMIQMTLDINGNWQDHVGNTGVTCYTCHRGKNVPEYIWFEAETPAQAKQMLASPTGQNVAGMEVGSTSLPYDPFAMYLDGEPPNIRVASERALPIRGTGSTIQDTEATYALMIHMSNSLGVNCGYCHNSRAFASWEQSRPQRTTAWHGLQMVPSLNNDYLDPLQPEYPDYRLGPGGDAPKLNCSTCHQGVNKPLNGISMLPDFPSLAGQ